MLTFFPEPYPGEWWYSLVCRYFVRYGVDSYAAVITELFGKKMTDLGRLFPGPSCAVILSKLPAGLFEIRNVLLEHTLMPYYLRMYPLTKKQEFYNAIADGKCSGITSIKVCSPSGKQGPKYCPTCYQKDIRRFGEPYWHREHQIPLMATCPKHNCRLQQVEVNFARLSERLLPLCSVSCAQEVVMGDGWETELDSVLMDYLRLPFEVGPTLGYNNLEIALFGKGFTPRYLKKGQLLDAKKVYEACAEKFSGAVMDQYLRTPSTAVLYKMSRWVLTSPERYALFQVVAELSTDELFGPKIEGQDIRVQRLLDEMKCDKIFSKKVLAEKVGVNPSQLDSLVALYGIEPFWRQTQKGKLEKREHVVRLNLTSGEKELIYKAAEISGNEQIAVFARQVLLNAMDKIIRERSV